VPPQAALQTRKILMNPSAILPATFVLSITGLSAFIGSLRKGLFDTESTGAQHFFVRRDRPGRRDLGLRRLLRLAGA
jgi:hypothetical protein